MAPGKSHSGDVTCNGGHWQPKKQQPRSLQRQASPALLRPPPSPESLCQKRMSVEALGLITALCLSCSVKIRRPLSFFARARSWKDRFLLWKEGCKCINILKENYSIFWFSEGKSFMLPLFPMLMRHIIPYPLNSSHLPWSEVLRSETCNSSLGSSESAVQRTERWHFLFLLLALIQNKSTSATNSCDKRRPFQKESLTLNAVLE